MPPKTSNILRYAKTLGKHYFLLPTVLSRHHSVCQENSVSYVLMICADRLIDARFTKWLAKMQHDKIVD